MSNKMSPSEGRSRCMLRYRQREVFHFHEVGPEIELEKPEVANAFYIYNTLVYSRIPLQLICTVLHEMQLIIQNAVFW